MTYKQCEHNIIIDNGFSVCDICGKVITYDLLLNKYQRNDSFKEVINGKTYTHEVRFKKLLFRLFMLSSPPPIHIIEYLIDKKPETIQEIRHYLKKNPFKHKHYEFLSFFANILL